MVRVAHRLEREVPILPGLTSEGVWLAGDRVHTTAHGADFVVDLFLVASQLEATRRSPQSAVEVDQDEVVLPEDLVEPTQPRAGQRVDLARRIGRVGLGAADIEAGGGGTDPERLPHAEIALAKHQGQLELLVRLSARQNGIGIDHASEFERCALTFIPEGERRIDFGGELAGDFFNNIRHGFFSEVQP